MSQVTLLYELQQLDNQIIDGKNQLTSVMASMKESAELVEARVEAERAAEKLKEKTTIQKDVELKTSSLRTKTEQSSKRMYSGTISDSRELLDLESSVASLKRRLATFEDELLEAMVELEDAKESKELADVHLAELESDHLKNSESLGKDKMRLALAINEQLQARKKHVARLDAPILARYDKLRRKKGSAVAILKMGTTCSGCNMSISSTVIKSIRQGQLTHCPSCDRIIMLPPSKG